VTKVRIWQYCAQKLDTPLLNVSEDAVVSLVASEIESTMVLASPFRQLRLRNSFGSFKRAISELSPNVPTALAHNEFGKSRQLAQHLVSGNDKFSECPDFLRKQDAIRQVFGYRSYWSRLWIIQELLNAARVLIRCGKRCVDLDIMALIQLSLSKFLDTGPGHLFENGSEEFADSLWSALTPPLNYHSYMIEHRMENKNSLAYNLKMFTGCQCSDLRDKIYALLNISHPLDTKIDYSKSVAEVWIDTTRSIITYERSLNIICLLPWWIGLRNVRREPSKKFPSWMPRYTDVLSTGELCQIEHPNGEQLYQGGGAIPSSNKVQIKDSRVLQIQGCPIGRIEEVGPTFAFNDWKDINVS
jgi:hypothetical protein